MMMTITPTTLRNTRKLPANIQTAGIFVKPKPAKIQAKNTKAT